MTTPTPNPKKPNLRRDVIVAGICGVVAAMMVGAAYASVPLYSWFCRTTGFGGTTQVAVAAPGKVLGRMINVRFDSNVAPGLPWKFEPEQNEIHIHIGEVATVHYKVTNMAAREITAQAGYNVAPPQVGADQAGQPPDVGEHVDAGDDAPQHEARLVEEEHGERPDARVRADQAQGDAGGEHGDAGEDDERPEDAQQRHRGALALVDRVAGVVAEEAVPGGCQLQRHRAYEQEAHEEVRGQQLAQEEDGDALDGVQDQQQRTGAGGEALVALRAALVVRFCLSFDRRPADDRGHSAVLPVVRVPGGPGRELVAVNGGGRAGRHGGAGRRGAQQSA